MGKGEKWAQTDKRPVEERKAEVRQKSRIYTRHTFTPQKAAFAGLTRWGKRKESTCHVAK